MGKVFLKPQDATPFKPAKGQTLEDLLKLGEFAGLTYEDITFYNWGTTVKEEVNRALIELIGCSDVDADHPEKSKLDPDLGTRQPILIPKLYTQRVPSDKLEKTYTIKVKRRLPAPAVSITDLDQSFIPQTEECHIKHCLEGVTARADTVDMEVHVAAGNYYEQPDPNKPEFKLSSTDNEPDSTHLLRKLKIYHKPDPDKVPRPLPNPQACTWNGKSEATKGVMDSSKTACYVNVACSPYTILIRYYRFDSGKENKAQITLAPFWPCWNSANDKNPSPQPIEKSFKVHWKIKNDDGKLKIGQLLIWDKDNKVVFRAVLDKAKLDQGEYDLLNGVVKWDRSAIKLEAMPYRVQLQAHSTLDEDNGLALAVMHTAVKYEKIQFIAFNIKPDTKPSATTSSGSTYLGDPDPSTDLGRRCAIMKDAIKKACNHTEVKKDDHSVLKVFMAPEFYFRGATGAYPLEKISDIPETMRKETDQFIYADWLFVFGTAIGRLLHDESDKKTGKGTGKGIRHGGEEILNAEIEEIHGKGKNEIVVSVPSRRDELSGVSSNRMPLSAKQDSLNAIATKCALDKPDCCRLTLQKKHFWQKLSPCVGPVVLTKPVACILETSTAAGTTKIKVRSRLCSRITSDPVRLHWRVKQGFSESEILECIPVPAPNPQQDYWLTLKIEPKINLLILKIPSFVPGPVDLVEPEAVEVLNIALVQKGWPIHPPRVKELHDLIVYKEYVSPIDFLRPKSPKKDWQVGENRVIQLDDSALSTPDLPVLPTEGSRDLLGMSPNVPSKAYVPTKGGSALPDEQGVIHRVGSEVNLSGAGGGSVFTVDGVTFGLEVCLDHAQNRLNNFYNGKPPEPPAVVAGEPLVQVHLIPSWGMTIGGGKICCVKGGLVFNVDGARCDSVARLNDQMTHSCDDFPDQESASSGPCPTATEHFVCEKCNADRGSAPGSCPKSTCGAALVKYNVCTLTNQYHKDCYQMLGARVPPKGTSLTVNATDITTYFKGAGHILVYDVKDIPHAEVVK